MLSVDRRGFVMTEYTVSLALHAEDGVSADRIRELVGEVLEGDTTAEPVGRLLDEYLGQEGYVGTIIVKEP